MRVAVGQHDVGAQLPGQVRELEVEEKHAVDSLQAEHPVHAFLPLARDGLREVIECPLTEVDVLFVLHFDDKLFATLVRAIDVVDQSTVFFVGREQFLVEKTDVFHLSFAFQQGIEEVDEQVFVDFLPEDALEAHVGKGIDESCHVSTSFVQQQQGAAVSTS